jgi:hypothetical protein
MPVPAFCSVCEHPDRDKIDYALRGNTSLRSIEKTYAIGRTALTGHVRKHTTNTDARGRRVVAKNRLRGRRVKSGAESGLKPIENADDVVADLQRLRVEAFELFESAKGRADWKQAQMLFQSCLGLVDRFGEMYKVLGPKGVTINVDQRSVKVAAFYDALPKETLQRLAAGDISIEQIEIDGKALE